MPNRRRLQSAGPSPGESAPAAAVPRARPRTCRSMSKARLASGAPHRLCWLAHCSSAPAATRSSPFCASLWNSGYARLLGRLSTCVGERASRGHSWAAPCQVACPGGTARACSCPAGRARQRARLLQAALQVVHGQALGVRRQQRHEPILHRPLHLWLRPQLREVKLRDGQQLRRLQGTSSGNAFQASGIAMSQQRGLEAPRNQQQ